MSETFLKISKHHRIIDLLNLFDLEGKKNKYPDLSIYFLKKKNSWNINIRRFKKNKKKNFKSLQTSN